MDTNSQILAELVAVNEKLARLIDITVEAQIANSSYDYQPWAMRMSQEFVASQDMNGDGAIFGHTFYIDDFENYPLVLAPVRLKVQKLQEKADLNPLELARLTAVSPADHLKTLTDGRDIAAFKFIFRLED